MWVIIGSIDFYLFTFSKQIAYANQIMWMIWLGCCWILFFRQLTVLLDSRAFVNCLICVVLNGLSFLLGNRVGVSALGCYA
jgi:hypothetical protein